MTKTKIQAPTPDRHFFVDSDGVQLAVYVHEPANLPVDAETVVLVHGFPDSHRVWDPVVIALRGKVRVATYDVRGAGASDQPGPVSEYSLAHLSRDLQAVCDALCPDGGVHLVAHDWGSIQSWELVTDPSANHRLASYTGFSGPCLDHAAYWLKSARKTKGQRGAFLKQALSSWYIGAFQIPWLPEFVLGRPVPSAIEANGTSIGQFDTFEHDAVNGIKLYRANMGSAARKPERRPTDVPVKLIVLEADPYVGQPMARSAHQWATNIDEVTHRGGHWAMQHDPEFCASEVLSMVERTSTPS